MLLKIIYADGHREMAEVEYATINDSRLLYSTRIGYDKNQVTLEGGSDEERNVSSIIINGNLEWERGEKE